LDIEIAPGWWAVFDRLANGCCHCKNAGVSARDDADCVAFGGGVERGLGAVEFFAIIRGDAMLVGPEIKPVEIGAVAEELLALCNGIKGLRCRLGRSGGGGAGGGGASGHGRVLQPGTRIREK